MIYNLPWQSSNLLGSILTSRYSKSKRVPVIWFPQKCYWSPTKFSRWVTISSNGSQAQRCPTSSLRAQHWGKWPKKERIIANKFLVLFDRQKFLIRAESFTEKLPALATWCLCPLRNPSWSYKLNIRIKPRMQFRGTSSTGFSRQKRPHCLNTWWRTT